MMKKKMLILSLILFLAFFGYRLIFCYTLFPTGNTGNLKHKVDGVQYFPHVVFNPFKKSDLIAEIETYSQNNLSKNKSSKRAIWWSEQISNGEYELTSIKKENGSNHILVRHKTEDITIVLVQMDKKIASFY